MLKVGDLAELEYNLDKGRITIKRKVLIVAEDIYYYYVNTGHLKNTHIEKNAILSYEILR